MDFINNVKTLIKYGLWGFITTLINLLLFFILKSWGMYYIAANIISYIVAVFINYYINKKFVFNNTKRSLKEFIRFVIVRLVSLVVDNALFYFLVTILKLQVDLTRILLSLAIIIATYGVNKSLVFVAHQNHQNNGEKK